MKFHACNVLDRYIIVFAYDVYKDACSGVRMNRCTIIIVLEIVESPQYRPQFLSSYSIRYGILNCYSIHTKATKALNLGSIIGRFYRRYKRRRRFNFYGHGDNFVLFLLPLQSMKYIEKIID